jgi:hypothetical protein
MRKSLNRGVIEKTLVLVEEGHEPETSRAFDCPCKLALVDVTNAGRPPVENDTRAWRYKLRQELDVLVVHIDAMSAERAPLLLLGHGRHGTSCIAKGRPLCHPLRECRPAAMCNCVCGRQERERSRNGLCTS